MKWARPERHGQLESQGCGLTMHWEMGCGPWDVPGGSTCHPRKGRTPWGTFPVVCGCVTSMMGSLVGFSGHILKSLLPLPATASLLCGVKMQGLPPPHSLQRHCVLASRWAGGILQNFRILTFSLSTVSPPDSSTWPANHKRKSLAWELRGRTVSRALLPSPDMTICFFFLSLKLLISNMTWSTPGLPKGCSCSMGVGTRREKMEGHVHLVYPGAPSCAWLMPDPRDPLDTHRDIAR